MNEPKPLPSETKLVETPRVNAAVIYRCAAHSPVVHADLARQLERELSSAQTGIAVLNGIIRVRTAALASLADELENERQKVAGCSTAAIGYWKEGDSLHPDYECAAIHDVARLYAKVASLADELRLTREDADRYRWLKEHHLQTGTDTWIRTGDDLEDAIDAALKDAASSGPKES